MKHIFIVAYGRTGSTALMKALNCIEGACIRGENGGLLLPLAETFALSKAARRRHARDSRDDTRPWYGADQIRCQKFGAGLARAFTRSVLSPPDDARVAGFKEIRYTSDLLTDEAFDAVMTFMLTCFEDPRIVFLTRNPAQVADSAWWHDRDRDVVMDVLEHTVHRFQVAHEDFPERTYLIDHATFDGNPEGLRPLLAWLGEDAAPEALAEALSGRIAKPEEADPPTARAAN